jgi:protein transport protein SEC24
MLAKVALDNELRLGVAAARKYLHKALLDICRAYRAATTNPYGAMPGGMGGAPAGGMHSRLPMAKQAGMPPSSGGPGAAPDMAVLLPESLQMLPLYVMGLQKSMLFRGGEAIRSDERASLVYRALTMPVATSRGFIYPRLYSLHDLEGGAGRPDAAAEADPATAGQGRVTLPPAGTLSAATLAPGGCYLLDDGVEQYLWCGREVPAGLLGALFGPGLEGGLAGVDASTLCLVEQGNDYSARVVGIARTLALEAASAPKFRVVREGAINSAGGGGNDGLAESRFHWHMVEDRQAFPGGSVTYAEYVNIVAREAQQVSQMGSAPLQ